MPAFKAAAVATTSSGRAHVDEIGAIRDGCVGEVTPTSSVVDHDTPGNGRCPGHEVVGIGEVDVALQDPCGCLLGGVLGGPLVDAAAA